MLKSNSGFRYPSIDILRILAIFAVVAEHTVRISAPFSAFKIFLIYSFHWAVPVFFSLSVFLYSNKDLDFKFLKSRLYKIVIPFLIAFVFYTIFYSIYNNQELSFNLFLSILAGKISPHLWYFYSILSLYLFIFFFKDLRIRETKAILLYLISICLVYLLSNRFPSIIRWIIMMIPYALMIHLPVKRLSLIFVFYSILLLFFLDLLANFYFKFDLLFSYASPYNYFIALFFYVFLTRHSFKLEKCFLKELKNISHKFNFINLFESTFNNLLKDISFLVFVIYLSHIFFLDLYYLYIKNLFSLFLLTLVSSLFFSIILKQVFYILISKYSKR